MCVCVLVYLCSQAFAGEFLCLDVCSRLSRPQTAAVSYSSDRWLSVFFRYESVYPCSLVILCPNIYFLLFNQSSWSKKKVQLSPLLALFPSSSRAALLCFKARLDTLYNLSSMLWVWVSYQPDVPDHLAPLNVIDNWLYFVILLDVDSSSRFQGQTQPSYLWK